MTATAAPTAVRVWDLPTRLFHWALVLCATGSVVSGKLGGAAMAWHLRLGLAIGALLAFRLLWGLVGGRWSRFASFVPTPGRIGRYLRGRPLPGEHLDVGHSPLGGLSVIALLGLLLLQVGTGLVADDEIATTGPLNRFVAGATASAATAWHKGWGQGLLIALVALHVTAVAVYALWRRTDLLRPMVSGDKRLPPGTPASADGWAMRLLAGLLFAGCAAAAAWLAALGG